MPLLTQFFFFDLESTHLRKFCENRRTRSMSAHRILVLKYF